MRKILLRLIVIIMAIYLVACAHVEPKADKWATIRIGTEGEYPPFNYLTRDGELAGFDIEIAKALCKEMGVRMVPVIQDWDEIIPALISKKYDAIIASMMITESRKKKLSFIKYYQTPARFIVKKGTMDKFSDEALKRKIIGVQRYTIYDKYLSDNYKNYKIRRYNNLDEVFLNLVTGKIDLVFADSAELQYAFLEKTYGKNFQFIGPGSTDPKWFGIGAGIAIRKEDRDLVEKFKKALAAIRANGTYKKIQDKYFDFDVYE